MGDQQRTRTVEAHFEIIEFEENVYDEPAEGPKLTRVRIRKRYHGVVEGSGVVDVLTAQGRDGAGYVASERVEGILDGRRGTFVIQHGGSAEGTAQRTFGTIIPGSGTGELTGISGRAEEAQREVLTLEYTL
ncbi:DUF3224 domain-containing protein [Nocardia sp. NPDC051990]|uniref:DUF3224 domain-containing protein n=1 Tax=Nocardia sp. NPDC051990 TaxID=3155285 RepID=UPI00341E005E